MGRTYSKGGGFMIPPSQLAAFHRRLGPLVGPHICSRSSRAAELCGIDIHRPAVNGACVSLETRTMHTPLAAIFHKRENANNRRVKPLTAAGGGQRSRAAKFLTNRPGRLLSSPAYSPRLACGCSCWRRLPRRFCHGCCGGCDTRRVAVCAALPATHGRGAPKLGFAYLKCDKTGLSASRKAVSAVNIAINIQARLRSLLELSRIAFIIFHHNSIIFTPPPNSTLLYARSLV